MPSTLTLVVALRLNETVPRVSEVPHCLDYDL